MHSAAQDPDDSPITGGSSGGFSPGLIPIEVNGEGFMTATDTEDGYIMASPSATPQEVAPNGYIAGLTDSTLGKGEGPYYLVTPNGNSGSTILYCYNGGSPVGINLNGVASGAGGGVSGRAISNDLVIPMYGQIWRNGAAHLLTNLCGSGTSNWSNITSKEIAPGADMMIGTATYSGTDSTIASGSHGILLVPAEIDAVNRDDLTQTWSNNHVQSASVPVYSGSTAGDMVQWKLDVPSTWENATFTWRATGSNGTFITGPTGTGIDHWQISNSGNDPTGQTTLTWKPDTYTINCNIAFAGGQTSTAQLTQRIGWRTEDYLVIGQIVNTNTYSGPTSGSDSNYVSAISYDIGDNLGLGGYSLAGWVLPYGSGTVLETVLDSGAVSDSTLGMMELGFWGSVGGGSTPEGPFDASYPNNIGAISSDQRFWILQNGLNFSVDDPSGAPSTIPATSLATLEGNQQYRLFHHYQTRFCLTSSGKIDTTTLHDIHSDAQLGPTKINWSIPAGTYSFSLFGIGVSNPQIGPFTVPAHANPKNGSVQTSSDGTQHSSYASGRIGVEGQNANWRVFGMDVPWIFSEIICQVASDHTVTSTIKTSVNKTWQPSGWVPGGHNFNNLNIYKAVLNPIDDTVTYTSQAGSPISMNGQVEPFVDSIHVGTWPSAPPTPTVQ